ncbi:MAG: MBL fold metallo-hydrolase [Saprospiraceae bacterium]
MNFISNPELPFIIENYQGNPISSSGRFFHPTYPFKLGWADVAKWKTKPNPYAEAKKKETWRAAVIKDDGFLKHNKNVFVWLGHASFFFRLNGKNILVDPVFGQLSFLMPRYSELPIDPNKFNNIDYILLTHDHRDHCDLPSLKILSKNNPQVKIICGLNMSPIISSLFNKENITEMGWHQQFTDEENDLKITYLPTRHWCRRFLTDTNRRLWGAFVFETENKTIYFGGDSGYGNHFKSTAELFPTIDFAFLGIGAFAPVWFMESNHMSPSAAFNAFKDLKARRFVPMHFGTFDLSDEPLGEPLRLLKGIHEEHGLNGEVLFSEIGRAVHV